VAPPAQSQFCAQDHALRVTGCRIRQRQQSAWLNFDIPDRTGILCEIKDPGGGKRVGK
jgi:hypothetical protein